MKRQPCQKGNWACTNIMEIDHFILEARSIDVVNERGDPGREEVIEFRQKLTIG